jgi:hypothetical protein
MKSYFCPNRLNKCFSSSPNNEGFLSVQSNNKVLYLRDQVAQVAGTSLEFGQQDTCGWRIIADTQYTTEKIIKLKIESVFQVSCFITKGTSIKTVDTESSCAQGTEYTFDAD